MSKLLLKSLLTASISAAALQPLSAAACGVQPYLGEVCTSGYNFCPRGYLPAAGQILSIAQNTALFSLLGTTYGGDGRTTFALPDLRGRSTVGMGQGPGLSNIDLGEMGGTESVVLQPNNIPNHTHSATTIVTVDATLNSVNGTGNGSNPVGKSLAASSVRDNVYSSTAPNAAMAAGAVTATANASTTIGTAGGGNQPFGVRSPFVVLTQCIATQGIFPSRP